MMDDEPRATGGLGISFDRLRNGPRRGRRLSNRQGYRSGERHPRGQTYAALDLGTNNCRLLIACPTADSFRVVSAFSRIIRLGEGVSSSGRIGEPAIMRAVEALAVCRDKMHSRDVDRARLIATEACRAALNGEDFRARIETEVGLELEIIDRETEATLAATGCTTLIDPDSNGVILFDIGGGSSEIVRLGPSRPAANGPPAPQIRAWTSLPVGVVTLAERFGGIHIDRALFEAMVSDVEGLLRDFAAEHGHDIDGMHMLGTSGTVTTIAGVHLDLPRYDRKRVDGCWMRSGEVTGVVERLIEMTYEERVANPCIGADRADLVLAGCAIMEAIRRYFPFDRLRVADRGLREGMLVQMMRDDDVWSQSAGPGDEPR